MTKNAKSQFDPVAWTGVVLGLIGTITGVRGCMTSETSVKIAREMEFKTYVYDAADLIGARPGDSHSLVFAFDITAGTTIQVDRGSFEKARRLLEKARLLNPDDADLLALEAFYYMGLRDVENALKKITRLAELESGEPEPSFLAIAAIVASVDPRYHEQADRLFRRAISIEQSSTELLLAHAMFLHRVERNTEAENVMRQALRLEPTNPALLNGLAHVLYESDKRGDAIVLIEEAVRDGIRSAPLHNTFGVILESIPDLANSAIEFKKAIELQPDAALYHANLSIVLKRLKRIKEAKAAEERAKSLGIEIVGPGVLAHM